VPAVIAEQSPVLSPPLRKGGIGGIFPTLGVLFALLASFGAQALSPPTVLRDFPLEINLPDNFSPAGDGRTFRHDTLNGVVDVTKIEAPYADVIKVFTAEELANRGMRLVSKDNVTASGRAALLLNVAENTPGASIFRWTLVIGDYQETFMVSGTYPKAEETQLSAGLRAAVLSTRWTKRDEADPFVNFRFAVTASPKLTFAKELETLLAFTPDGVFPLVGPGDPLMVVGYEVNDEKIVDERAFAIAALKETPHCTQVKPKETNAVTLGGLQGFESTATATHEGSGKPVEVYQCFLFADGYHFYILGVVDQPRAAEYLPEFRASARTFKMKQ